MFKVRKTMCPTCIYRPGSPLDVKELEDQCRDEHGHLTGHRICHYHQDVCCRGFWQAHREDATTCQVADRMQQAGLLQIEFTDE